MATYKYLSDQGMLCFIEAESCKDAAQQLKDAEIKFIPGSLKEVQSNRQNGEEKGR